MKSNKNNDNLMLPGQITLWDIEITEKPKKITEIATSCTKIEEKSSKTYDLCTDLQSKVIEQYKQIEALNRIIKYCGGGVGIELQYENVFKTIYINTKGEKEFTSDKRLPVLPMDKIVYYKSPEVKVNNVQEERLKEIRGSLSVAKVIKRKADDNILLEFADKVISINKDGWVLEFQKCAAVYEEDEVERHTLSIENDIRDIQSSIKLGDVVEAYYGQEIIKGEIVRVYGPGDVTLNISFDNRTKQTAIHRSKVIKLIQCA